MRAERARLSRHDDVAKAMDYMLKRWPAFTRFLDDGRICLTNNAAERALRCVALGRQLDLLRLRSGRRAGRGDLHADRHRQAQRHRSRSLARRRAPPHQRPSGLELNELLPWRWKRPSRTQQRPEDFTPRPSPDEYEFSHIQPVVTE